LWRWPCVVKCASTAAIPRRVRPEMADLRGNGIRANTPLVFSRQNQRRCKAEVPECRVDGEITSAAMLTPNGIQADQGSVSGIDAALANVAVVAAVCLLAATPVNIGEKLSSLRGQTVGGWTGRQLSGVCLELATPEWDPLGERISSDSQGRFRFRALRAGRYILSAGRPGSRDSPLRRAAGSGHSLNDSMLVKTLSGCQRQQTLEDGVGILRWGRKAIVQLTFQDWSLYQPKVLMDADRCRQGGHRKHSQSQEAGLKAS
jgi:hypothetical protein